MAQKGWPGGSGDLGGVAEGGADAEIQAGEGGGEGLALGASVVHVAMEGDGGHQRRRPAAMRSAMAPMASS